MRFRFMFFGVDILEFEFAWPARGLYPVPEDIPSEYELMDLYSSDEDEE